MYELKPNYNKNIVPALKEYTVPQHATHLPHTQISGDKEAAEEIERNPTTKRETTTQHTNTATHKLPRVQPAEPNSPLITHTHTHPKKNFCQLQLKQIWQKCDIYLLDCIRIDHRGPKFQNFLQGP